MRPGRALLAPALAALLLAAACGSIGKLGDGISKLGDAEHVSDLVVGPGPAPADPRLLPALAGRWRMQAKRTDALVPNITFVLRPDGALDFYRDDDGGTNFSSRFSGTWAASSPAPGRFQITFAFTDAEPRRRCLALPGECSEYELPFRETWSFTEGRPGTMETPGAVWWRSELPPDETAAAPGGGSPASEGDRTDVTRPAAPVPSTASGEPAVRPAPGGADAATPPAVVANAPRPGEPPGDAAAGYVAGQDLEAVPPVEPLTGGDGGTAGGDGSAGPARIDPGSPGGPSPVAVVDPVWEPVAPGDPAPLGAPVPPDAMAEPTAVAPARTEAAPSAGRYAIYFFSVRPAARISREWRRLVERHPDLAGLELQTARPVEVPGKGTFYAVEAGAFATRAEAQAVCDRLRSQGRSCRALAR